MTFKPLQAPLPHLYVIFQRQKDQLCSHQQSCQALLFLDTMENINQFQNNPFVPWGKNVKIAPPGVKVRALKRPCL
jgi:hypothetical protein